MKITTKTKKLLADTLTPVSVYLKIRDSYPNSILLESTDFHHLENCYSFICVDPITGYTVENNKITIDAPDQSQSQIEITNRTEALTKLQEFIDSNEFDENTPDYNGYFGYTSYDAVRFFDTLDLKAENEKQAIADIRYHLYRYVIAFNHLKMRYRFAKILLIRRIQK